MFPRKRMPRWDTFKLPEVVANSALGGYVPEETSGVPVTPSVTPSNTPTPSVTASGVLVTPSITPTNTPTASITASPTLTPTQTSSNTPTPSITASPTLTPTASITASPTLTPTSSNTPTPSITASPTETPTNTPTPSITASPTETPTNTPTPTSTLVPFSPLNISGLKIWVDPDDTSTYSTRTSGSTNFITQIANKAYDGTFMSGFTQTTASLQPIVRSGELLNSSNQTFFISTDMGLNGTSIMTGSTWEVVLVYKGSTSGATPNQGCITIAVSQSIFQYYLQVLGNGPDKIYNYWRTNGPESNIIFQGNYTQASVMNHYLSTSAVTPVRNVQLNLSAATQSDGLFSRAGAPGTIGNNLVLFKDPSFSNPNTRNIEFGEILCYNRQLTTAERTDLYNYLNNKWIL